MIQMDDDYVNIGRWFSILHRRSQLFVVEACQDLHLTYSEYVSNAFRTLEKTLLLELVYPQTTASFPILPDLKKSPKLLWLDTGLVNYVAGMQEDLLFSADSDELWNGDIAEHVVAHTKIYGHLMKE